VNQMLLQEQPCSLSIESVKHDIELKSIRGNP
jgi:hypothetical protein